MNTSKKITKLNKFLKILLEVCFVFAVIIAGMMCYMSIVYIYSPVLGQSMSPTINEYGNTDNVYINKYNKGQINDIIVVDTKEMRQNEEVYVIKRLIAVGGQRIDIKLDENKYAVVYINGVILDEPYVKNKEQGSDIKNPYTYDNFKNYVSSNMSSIDYNEEKGGLLIPDNYVFIMGDNRGNGMSVDSCKYGPVSKSNIIGKVDILVKNGENNISCVIDFFLGELHLKQKVSY
jgi:signal peptidase I